MLDAPMTKKMLGQHVREARKETHKPVSKMNKADLIEEYRKYRSTEDVMSPAISSVSQTAKLAYKMGDVGSMKPIKQHMDSSSDEDEPVAKKAVHKKKFPFIEKKKAEERHMKAEPEHKSAPSKKAEPERKTEKKAPSAYNMFMAKHRKMGHSMADIAELWKKQKK
jgi:hypothetical protein